MMYFGTADRSIRYRSARIKALMFALACIMIASLASVTFLSDGAYAESVEIGLYDSAGNIFDGKIMDGMTVGIDTETVEGYTTYVVREGMAIPTTDDYYLMISSDIQSGFRLGLVSQGMEGTWIDSSGLRCSLSATASGEPIATAEIFDDGAFGMFYHGPGLAVLKKDTRYHLSFSAAEEARFDTVP